MSEMQEPVSPLSAEECWALLEDNEFGRLAYRLVDEVHLVPINYLVDNGALLFRTAPGSKLLAAALQSDVAFEIDWYDAETAWSVEVRGRLRRLEENELYRAESVIRRSWLPTDKPEVIELLPEQVAGRRFVLRRPKTDQHATR